MREKLSTLVCCCVLGAFAAQALAANPVTIRCDADSKSVTGGDTVVVDCFIDGKGGADIAIAGLQIDLPCSVPAQMGSTGAIDGGVVSVDDGRSDYIFPSGFYATNPSLCTIAPTKGLGPPANLTGAGSFYVGTITYTVSNTAAGGFNMDLEGWTDPPVDANSTKVRDDPAQNLVALKVIGTKIVVETGTCCAGLTCLSGPVNQVDCEVKQGGTWNPTAQLCTDPNPCACTSDAACDDQLVCTRQHLRFRCHPRRSGAGYLRFHNAAGLRRFRCVHERLVR